MSEPHGGTLEHKHVLWSHIVMCQLHMVIKVGHIYCFIIPKK